MTELKTVLKQAPCLLRHMRGQRHASIVSWSQHVPCMVEALKDAGLIDGRDLRERLSEKAPLLEQMSDDATDSHESFRLDGKAGGVRLALSFVDEALR